MDNSDRRKEILNVCLDTFINKGLSETTVRDLSTALKLQSGGIYYWFKDKDEAVVACAEEAALRLENPRMAEQKNGSIRLGKNLRKQIMSSLASTP